jgi:D-alanyl-D-alanine carboxypeptidase
MITTSQLIKKYGTPNETGAGYLVPIALPYPMRLAWDKKTKVNRMMVHKLVANKFLLVFNDLLAHYGYDKIVELGIDLFGGCFNYRKMRGGNDFSRHSWGVAIDLDPERNLLKENAKTARFARPEYKPMIDIFYKHGFVSLGVEKGYDFMHFEIKE